MSRIHVYGDEAGNFDFSRGQGATRYFILTTVTLEDHNIGEELLALRRDLSWAGVDLPGAFHATTDKQAVRNQVFSILTRHDFRIDTTILDKPKAMPHIRPTDERFYKYAWYYHMKYVTPRLLRKGDELMVVGASIGTKKKHRLFHAAIDDVIAQSSRNVFVTACWPAETDPCLQVADYCCWAIQRKWEGRDPRSYNLIKDKIMSEFDMWQNGTTLYY